MASVYARIAGRARQVVRVHSPGSVLRLASEMMELYVLQTSDMEGSGRVLRGIHMLEILEHAA